MINFAAGLAIGLIVGGSIGLIFAGLFAASKKDEQQLEVALKMNNDNSKNEL